MIRRRTTVWGFFLMPILLSILVGGLIRLACATPSEPREESVEIQLQRAQLRALDDILRELRSIRSTLDG